MALPRSPASEPTMPSIGLTMNWLIATRSKSARIASTSWSMEDFPDTAARAMVAETALKLLVTAFSIVVVASSTGPFAKSVSVFAAPSKGSAIGKFLHHLFKAGACQRRGAFRQSRQRRAPFGQRHRPERRGRETHRADTEF